MADLFLGIDTSNYTTSAAFCDGDGRVVFSVKHPLPVKTGERGLRQSDAVFGHVKNLEAAGAEAAEFLKSQDGARITAVGVSATPRDAEGSYMPCFLPGIAAAGFAAMADGIPVYRFSHQAGHVMAAAGTGEAAEKRLWERQFIAFHMSGGTSDVLLCSPDWDRIISCERIGGTLDLNCGQAVDRTGVMLGIAFPCGRELDALAVGYEDGGGKTPAAKTSVKGVEFNLSGLENLTEGMIRDGRPAGEVAAFTLSYIAEITGILTDRARETYGDLPVLYAGGVMSSGFIRRRLGGKGTFALPEFSSDNAAGAALLAREKHIRAVARKGEDA